MVAPLQKLTPKANATIKDIGSIDSLVQSFGPYITGMILLNILHYSTFLPKVLFHHLIVAASKCGDQWYTMSHVMQCSACAGYCGELGAKFIFNVNRVQEMDTDLVSGRMLPYRHKP